MRVMSTAVTMVLAAATLGAAVSLAYAQSCQELWYERNTYYKQGGFCFKTARAINTFGNAGRNTLRSDGLKNFDLGLSRAFRITEKVSLQFRSEFFNLANHPNFFLNDQTVNNASFGRITSQNISNDGVGPRVMQFGLYYKF